jgi:hypothetical protein
MAARAEQAVVGVCTARRVPRFIEQPEVVEVAQRIGHIPGVEVRPRVPLLGNLLDHPGRVVPEVTHQFVPGLADHGNDDVGPQRSAVAPDRVAAAAAFFAEKLTAPERVTLQDRVVAPVDSCHNRED